MEFFLKKISEKNFDEDTHSEFIKFSKGLFKDKYLIEAKKQKDKWIIKTGPEYANFLVSSCLPEKGELNIKGAIITTLDIEKDLDLELKGIKKFMGIKQYQVDGLIQSEKIISLMKKYPRIFFALSFTTPINDLKIQPKAPKSAKPSQKGEAEAKANFCSLKTTDKKIVEELFFDIPSFEQIRINHTIIIEKIIMPEGIKDIEEIRRKAKRKGYIKREILVDGKSVTKEYAFEA